MAEAEQQGLVPLGAGLIHMVLRRRCKMLLSKARHAILLACLVPSALARAADTDADEKAPEEQPCHNGFDLQHVVGATLDFGGGHTSFGPRYMHVHRSTFDCSPRGGLAWLGYGLDLRMNDGEAGVAYTVGRAGLFFESSGASIEAGLGAGTNFEQKARGVGFVALLYSFYFLEFGGTCNLRLGSRAPSWLPAFEFALRINIPVFTYGEQKRAVEGDAEAPAR